MSTKLIYTAGPLTYNYTDGTAQPIPFRNAPKLVIVKGGK